MTDTDTANDRLFDALNQAISSEETFALPGPAQLTIDKGEGVFKRQNFLGSEEFFYTGVREGKRDSVIFMLKPCDARDFKHVELNETDAKKFLPALLAYLASRLVEGADDFGKARKAFLKNANRAINAEKEQAAEIAANKERAKYANNPNWGSW